MRRFRYMFQSSPAQANVPNPIPSSKYVSKNSAMRMNYGQPQQQQQQQTFVSTTQRRRSCRCCQKDTTPPENDNTGEDVVGGIEDIHTDGGTGQVCHTGSKPCIGQGVSGCTLIDNSNICCTDWNADGSGCTDQSNVCGVGVDVSLCGRTYKECSGGKISQDAIWEPAYFFSGGERYDGAGPIPYDMSDILQSTPLCQEGTHNPKPNCKKRSGADPSCGASDFATLSTCILGVPLSALNHDAGMPFHPSTRKSYNYPAQDMSSALHNLMTKVHQVDPGAGASNNGKICYTIETSGGDISSSDANGTVQFVANPDVSGMVPVLAHGTFGVPLVAAGCTSNVYTGGSTEEIKTAYFKRTQALAAILGAGSCLSGGPIGECLPTNTTYVTYYKAKSSKSGQRSNYICLITEKAFRHAGLATLYNKLAPNNGGVGVAWGHGVKNGACGSFYFLKQGNTKGWPTTSTDASYNDISYANNVVLLAQIGMRAWSGEWNDSIGTQVPPFDTSANKFNDSLDGASQSYITENLPYNSDSTTCLQPLMSDVDIRAVDRLINLICPTLPLNRHGHHPCDIPQQNGICKCDPSAADMKGVPIKCPDEGVCDNASYKSRELCDSYKPWGCGKWIQQTCEKSGIACNDLSDCNHSTDSSLNCGSCSNGKCQATKCIGKSAPCDKNGLQCCNETRDNIKCRRTDDNPKNPYICLPGTNKGGYKSNYTGGICCCEQGTGNGYTATTCAKACIGSGVSTPKNCNSITT